MTKEQFMKAFADAILPAINGDDLDSDWIINYCVGALIDICNQCSGIELSEDALHERMGIVRGLMEAEVIETRESLSEALSEALAEGFDAPADTKLRH